MTDILATCVPPGWKAAATLSSPSFSTYRLLFYSDTEVRFEHVCDRGDRGIIVCAPMLTNVNQPGGHQITGTLERPTVRASILCPDCNTHGFVTQGRWESC